MMRNSTNIRTRAQRLKLKPRAFPYFAPVSKGRALGYRKTKTGGAWIARRVKRQKRIGGENVGFDEALRSALAWFDRLDGGAAGRYTVAQAISDYTRHIAAERGMVKARAYQCVMTRHVPVKMMNAEIDRLLNGQITHWLHELVLPLSHDRPALKQSTANVVLSKFRAALNYAWRNKYVSGNRPWTAIEPFKGANNQRDLYLTPEQVAQLLDCAVDEFKVYCKAVILIGARPGEVANIRVRDYVQEHNTLRLSGKTGERTVILSEEALRLVKSLTVGRKREAFMLTCLGEKWTAKTWGQEMERTRQAAKLPNETVVYSLRHYYISRALLAGVSVQLIEKNCGTSMEMISKYYGKFMASDQANMLDRVSLIPT